MSRIKLVFVTCLFLAVYSLHYGWISPPKTRVTTTATVNNIQQNVIIALVWTPYWRTFRHPKVRHSVDCPYLNTSTSSNGSPNQAFTVPCIVTYDRAFLNSSDAIVFHPSDLKWEDMPSHKSDKQIWVFMQQEPPTKTKNTYNHISQKPGIFDWTMTYRRDSDVYYPYGHFVPFEREDTNFQIRPEWKNRTKLVAWIVSNCKTSSMREEFVRKLKKFIPVDIYGKCGGGSMTCPHPQSQNCYDFVNSTHKFYLSFENSLCTDYITEKFFHALNGNMVAVVYGGSSSSDYSAVAPKGSYIDVRDFQTVNDLADYLVYLDENDSEYEKYFEWKRKFYVLDTGSPGQSWCSLCQRLFEERLNPMQGERKKYPHVLKWWSYCQNNDSRSISPVCLDPIQRFTSS